jgi:hypothetical protein
MALIFDVLIVVLLIKFIAGTDAGQSLSGRQPEQIGKWQNFSGELFNLR